MIEEKCTFGDNNENCNCILHSNTHKDKDNFKLFNLALEKALEEENKYGDIQLKEIYFSKMYNLEKMHNIFDKYKDKEIFFSNCRFQKLNYNNLSENKKELKNIRFYNCKFDEINFQGIIFDKQILKYDNSNEFYKINLLKLKNCQVKSEFIFKSYNQNRKFKIDNVDISHSIFDKSFVFEDIQNCSKFNMDYTEFNSVVDFTKTHFDEISLKATIFQKLVLFNEVLFKGSLNLSSTIFKDEVNFLGIKNKNGKNLETDNIKNRETARIIKHSFEKLDNIIEANKFYALEMQKREEELSKEKNWSDLIVFKFHKISSNHSQDWLLALLWMINLTFVYTAFQFVEVVDSHWLYLYSFLSIGLIITSIEGLACLEIPKDYKGLFCIIFIFLNWISYSLITDDYTMCYASNNFNPFSIMTGKESLSFGTLIYKAIIAFLIYQFIISIRQNTRRK